MLVSKVWRLFGRFQSVKLRKTAIRFFGEQEILKVSLVAAFQNDPMVVSTLFFLLCFEGAERIANLEISTPVPPLPRKIHQCRVPENCSFWGVIPV